MINYFISIITFYSFINFLFDCIYLRNNIISDYGLNIKIIFISKSNDNHCQTQYVFF